MALCIAPTAGGDWHCAENLNGPELHGFFFFPTEGSGVIDIPDLDRRLRWVIARENGRRELASVPPLPPFEETNVAKNFEEFLTIVKKSKIQLKELRSQFGGPFLLAFGDYVMPSPGQSRYNHEIKVYQFGGGQEVCEMSYTEFAVNRLPGPSVRLFRRLMKWDNKDLNAARSEEAWGWKCRSIDRLVQAGRVYARDHAEDAYTQDLIRTYKDFSFHFTINNFWGGGAGDEDPRLIIEIPKSELLILAEEGNIVIGNTLFSSTELLAYRGSWSALLRHLVSYEEPEPR